MENLLNNTLKIENLPEYLYTDNSEGRHGEIIFKCNAENIKEADVLFENHLHYDPKIDSNIGCVVESTINEPWREKTQNGGRQNNGQKDII